MSFGLGLYDAAGAPLFDSSAVALVVDRASVPIGSAFSVARSRFALAFVTPTNLPTISGYGNWYYFNGNRLIGCSITVAATKGAVDSVAGQLGNASFEGTLRIDAASMRSFAKSSGQSGSFAAESYHSIAYTDSGSEVTVVKALSNSGLPDFGLACYADDGNLALDNDHMAYQLVASGTCTPYTIPAPARTFNGFTIPELTTPVTITVPALDHIPLVFVRNTSQPVALHGFSRTAGKITGIHLVCPRGSTSPSCDYQVYARSQDVGLPEGFGIVTYTNDGAVGWSSATKTLALADAIAFPRQYPTWSVTTPVNYMNAAGADLTIYGTVNNYPITDAYSYYACLNAVNPLAGHVCDGYIVPTQYGNIAYGAHLFAVYGYYLKVTRSGSTSTIALCGPYETAQMTYLTEGNYRFSVAKFHTDLLDITAGNTSGVAYVGVPLTRG